MNVTPTPASKKPDQPVSTIPLADKATVVTTTVETKVQGAPPAVKAQAVAPR